jgi:hypothetical protein
MMGGRQETINDRWTREWAKGKEERKSHSLSLLSYFSNPK